MSDPKHVFDSADGAQAVSLQASQVFVPNTSIRVRELFSGRLRQITIVIDTINQTGLHGVIYGERGVGKTSLANIIAPLMGVLDEKTDSKTIVVKVNSHANDSFSSAWLRALGELLIPIPGIGFHPQENGRQSLAEKLFPNGDVSMDDVRRTLRDFGMPSVFVFDEFDRMPQDQASWFTDLMKTLSDFAIPSTIVLVGVADSVSQLVADHRSISRALTQIQMPRMHSDELRAILSKGEEILNVSFHCDASDFIVRVSQGLPHYTHLLGQHSVRVACARQSREITFDDVSTSLAEVVSLAQHTVIEKFTVATRSAHKDALYNQVLLACAICSSRSTDELGFFQPSSIIEPLCTILPGKEIKNATFSSHLSDFCEPARGPILERTGKSRNYRFRFIDPLLPPYVIINAIANDLITHADVVKLVRTLQADPLSSNEQLRLF